MSHCSSASPGKSKRRCIPTLDRGVVAVVLVKFSLGNEKLIIVPILK